MTITYTESVTYPSYDFQASLSEIDSSDGPEFVTSSSPWPEPKGVIEYFVNVVFDTAGPGFGAWVEWETQDTSDPDGDSYPNPYAGGYPGSTTHMVRSRRYRQPV